MSPNYRDNDQYRYYSASVQLFPYWKPRCAIPMSVRKVQQRGIILGDQTYKDTKRLM